MTKTIEEIVASGNLEELTSEQRTAHYMAVCQAMDLDWKMHPLEWVHVDDVSGGRRLILYALRTATDQIRRNKKIKITKLTKELSEDVITYICEGQDKDGITEISTGSVSIKGKRGQDLANAMMSAETKSKRRLTLAFSGSGLLDETEISDLNAPTSAPPGMGVTAAAPNLSAPAPSEKFGQEVTPVPAPVKEPEKTKKADQIAGAVASLKNKKVEPEPDKQADIVAVVETQSAQNQGVLIETKSDAEAVVVSVQETRDSLTSRITTYKRDILPAGGMRPSKGFGINAKLIKFFLVQFPDRKTVDQFTNEELSSVLARLDKVRAASGDDGVVKMVDQEIGLG